MRVQDVRDYVAWLLKDTPGWGRDQIDKVIRSGERLDVKLAQPVNVYTVYITAWQRPTAWFSSVRTSISATARARGGSPPQFPRSRWRCPGIAQALASSRRGTRFRTDPTGAAWINAIASFERDARPPQQDERRQDASRVCLWNGISNGPTAGHSLGPTERANRETWSTNYISAKPDF